LSSKPLTLSFTFFLLALGLGAQALPPLTATSLDGLAVTVPEPGKVTVLVIGFSQKGGDETGPWARRFVRDFGSEPGVAFYSVAQLSGVPGWLRPLIVGFIKNGTPTAERARFLTTFGDEAAWKAAAGFQQPDDAYVVVANPTGVIVYRAHGPFTETLYSSAAGVVRSLLNSPKKEL
jgi:hypothetical protein